MPEGRGVNKRQKKALYEAKTVMISQPAPTPPKPAGENAVTVRLGRRSYPIRIAPGLLSQVGQAAGLDPSSKIAVVSDKNVAGIYLDRLKKALRGFRVETFVVPPGEKSKSIPRLVELWNGFLAKKFGRDMTVIALGGGMVGDLAGFAAATFMRGVRLIQIPTTLLAMVDSSVGGKTAIDLDGGKNLVGAFHQPAAVFIDPTVLATLPLRQYRAGLGEVVKYAAALDKNLFTRLEKRSEALNGRDPEILTYVITACCRIKSRIVARDEFDTLGLRALLNFGHTFAHAYETADDFDSLLHGEAVTLGVVDALRLAERLREKDPRFAAITPGIIDRQLALIRSLGLIEELGPERHAGRWNLRFLMGSMCRDKKSVAGRVRFVLPTELGKSTVVSQVAPEDVRQVLRRRLAQ